MMEKISIFLSVWRALSIIRRLLYFAKNNTEKKKIEIASKN